MEKERGIRNRWVKRLFPVFSFLLLAPWPVAYAHGFSEGGADRNSVIIETAQPAEAPAWTAYGKAIGGVVSQNDLFYLDATSRQADIQATIYLTNTDDLVRHYRFLMLKIGVYVENAAGNWEKARGDNGELLPETLLSMFNGQASFNLVGLAKYKITLDDGSFYSTGARSDSDGLAPRFYLETN